MHLQLVRMKFFMGHVAMIVETHSTGGNWSEAGGWACVPVTTCNESKFYVFE